MLSDLNIRTLSRFIENSAPPTPNKYSITRQRKMKCKKLFYPLNLSSSDQQNANKSDPKVQSNIS